jgi:hypothetical protein
MLQSFNSKTNRTLTQGISLTSNYVILTLKLFGHNASIIKRFTSIKTRHENNKDIKKRKQKQQKNSP